MTRYPAFPWIASIARWLLEPSDFDRVIVPSLADAWHERPAGPAPTAWRLRVAMHILRTSIVVIGARGMDAAARTRWWAFGFASLAGAAGCVGLQATMHGGGKPTAQWVFLGIGLCVGLLIVLLPPRWLRASATIAVALGSAALLAVVTHGTAFEGARRWICIGPICVHISTLVLPLFSAVIVRAARARFQAVAPVITIAALTLLALEPDPSAMVVYAVVATVASRSSRSLPAVAAISAVGSLLALSRRVPLMPVDHVEGAARLLALHNPLWFVVAMTAICALCVVAFATWRQAARRDCDAEPCIASATTALTALLFVPWLMGDGGLPWVSYGGSAVVAAFGLVAMIVRAEREGSERVGHLDRA